MDFATNYVVVRDVNAGRDFLLRRVLPWAIRLLRPREAWDYFGPPKKGAAPHCAAVAAKTFLISAKYPVTSKTC